MYHRCSLVVILAVELSVYCREVCSIWSVLFHSITYYSETEMSMSCDVFQLKLCGDEEEEDEGDEGEWSVANVFMTSLHHCLLSEDRFAIKRGQLNIPSFCE